MVDRDEELDAMFEIIEQAGLVETYVDSDGKAATRLTADGERVARQMAMSSDDEQDALLAALVGGRRVAARHLVPR